MNMVSAILVAAGKGVRLNKAVPKQYLMLGDRSILGHTLITFDTCQLIDRLYLVVPEGDFEFCLQRIIAPLNLSRDIQLVTGGAERQESVYNGLCNIEDRKGIVVIHDGVRPFVRSEKLALCISGAREYGACILGIPVTDTLKQSSQTGFIKGTIEREGLWQAQTPQAFRYDLIIKAHEQAIRDGFVASDDALLVERMGAKIRIVPGSTFNLKITTGEDMLLAQAIRRAGTGKENSINGRGYYGD